MGLTCRYCGEGFGWDTTALADHIETTHTDAYAADQRRRAKERERDRHLPRGDGRVLRSSRGDVSEDEYDRNS